MARYVPAAPLAGLTGSGPTAQLAAVELPARRPRPSASLALSLAAALIALWLIVDPRTPDLAAQVYRTGVFEHFGLTVWDTRWYAGHYLPGYSLLFPPLAATFGLRLVAAVSVIGSVLVFERLVVGHYGSAARAGAAFFALAAVADIWSGRLTFALGVSLGLAAVLAIARGRAVTGAALAGLCAAASPVAGALLALAGVSYALHVRSPRAALVLGLPAAAVLAPLGALFPEGGVEPYPLLSFLATVLVVGSFLWVLPPAQRLLRVGGVVYLVACVVCLLVHTPMGSNIERYAVLLAGPLLLCALLARRRPAASVESLSDAAPGASGEDGEGGTWRERALRPAVAVALGLSAAWIVWGPVRETLAVAGNESTLASYYAPVERFLERDAAGPARVEVPLTRSHWEAALLAPTVSLARGWEKQLDTRFNRPLLEPALDAAAYDRWLHEQAIAYVALPDTPLDPSSAREGRLIRRGLPFLREVYASRHWRIYAVDSPTPLASGPGRLTSLGHESFTLHALSPGTFLVHVHFTPFWAIAQGAGCVGPAPGGWTRVTVKAPGSVTVAASFSLSGALGLQARCLPGSA